MKTAWKRKVPRADSSLYGMVAPDRCNIWLKSHSPAVQNLGADFIKFVFYSDVYEGSLPSMEGGAVSPAFQDAMRQIGVPRTDAPKESYYSLRNIRWLIPQ